MIATTGIIIYILGLIGLFFLIDYQRLRIIKFRRLSAKYWEIAFTKEELFYKLDGELAEVEMPAAPLIIRLYRKFFPLRGVNF